MAFSPDSESEISVLDFALYARTLSRADGANMIKDSNGRTAVFFVARSHGDLSWYWSFDTLRPAANDRNWNDAGAATAAGSPRRQLSLVRPGKEQHSG
jgi:hypothetical protein